MKPSISVKKILFVCGILSSVLYTVMMTAIRYNGYSLTSQTVSELSAIGVPSRVLWITLGILYQGLMIAFGVGILMAAGSKRALRGVGILILLAYGVAGLVWPFASMHQREVLATGGGTVSDALHIMLGAVTIISNPLTIGLGAAAFGKRFRAYSLGTILLFLVFCVLTGIESPGISLNLPTPWIGVWERISILVFLQWIVALAVILLKNEWPQVSIKTAIQGMSKPE